jgi:hypothetical protein
VARRVWAVLCLSLPWALAHVVGAGEEPDPQALLKTLDPFYKQHVVVDGLLIVSSEKVSKHALDEAAWLVRKLLANRPDVAKALAAKKAYIGVMAWNEMTTALPECRGMGVWWDKRARGLGGNPVTCAEENLLAFKGDPYRGESIFIHEFAHALHRVMVDLEPALKERLRTAFEQAKATGRFRGYGMGNVGEFWAEGVQSWFDCNRAGGLAVRKPDGKGFAELNTRARLQEHLPALAALFDHGFRKNEWVYVPVLERLDEPHLRGYDPAKAPTFRWPRHVIEGYNRIEAEKARKREEKQQRRNNP